MTRSIFRIPGKFLGKNPSFRPINKDEAPETESDDTDNDEFGDDEFDEDDFDDEFDDDFEEDPDDDEQVDPHDIDADNRSAQDGVFDTLHSSNDARPQNAMFEQQIDMMEVVGSVLAASDYGCQPSLAASFNGWELRRHANC